MSTNTESAPTSGAPAASVQDTGQTTIQETATPDLVAQEQRKTEAFKSKNEREAKKAELRRRAVEGKGAAPATTDGDKPKADATVDTKAGAGAKADAKTDDEKPKADRSVQTIAKLNTEIRDLKTKLATFEGKPGVETAEQFIARAGKDLSVLLDHFGKEGNLLVKLSDAIEARNDPETRIKAEVDAKLAAMQKERDDERAARTKAETEARTQADIAEAHKYMTEGLKDADGNAVIDPAKLPYCAHLTKSGEINAPASAMQIAIALARDLGRNVNEAEAAKLLATAFDTLESDLKTKAERYRLEPPSSKEPSKTNTVDRAKDQKPKTLNSRMASGGRLPAIAPKPQTHAEREARKAEIRDAHVRRQMAERLSA